MIIKSNHEKKDFIGLVYILPFIIGFAVFKFYPFIMSLYYSFTEFGMFGDPKFVGIQNYIDIFTKDRDFFNSLKVTIIYTIIAVPLKIIFALFIAVILNQKLRIINIYRTVYYLPSILGGSVAVSILWKFLFIKDGIINSILAIIHIPKIDWLGSPDFALFTLSLLTVWQFGSSMVLFLAGLKNVPKDLYEAATVDGAGRIRTFFKITLPMISPIILFNLVMQTIIALQEFTAAFVVTDGGPLKSTYLYGMMIYEEAFQYLHMGYASALSWILFIIIVTLTGLIFKSSGRWAFYEDGGDF